MNKVTGVTEEKARSRGRSGSLDTHAHTTTKGSTPATCIGSTGITGQIDDSAGTITGNLNILSSDFSAPFAPGRYQLEATGTANSGTYNAGNRTFNAP